jgi:hypothetical protein
MKRLKEVRLKLWLISFIIATIVFVMMGTLTAPWHNPYDTGDRLGLSYPQFGIDPNWFVFRNFFTTLCLLKS